MNKDQELRGWKGHCVELQDRADRLELENANLKSTLFDAKKALVGEVKYSDMLRAMLRAKEAELQAVIDAANAQEPISNVDVYYDSNDSGDRILTWETFGSNFKSLGFGKHKLYARPIPAQQSQAVAGSEDVPADCLSPTVSRSRDYGDPSSLLKSQSVAAPEQKPAYYVNVPAGNPDGAHQFLKPAEWARHFTRCTYEPLYRAPLLQSPRITEQDAREIVTAWAKYFFDHDETVAIPDFEWSHHEWQFILRGILNKLNEAKFNG